MTAPSVDSRSSLSLSDREVADGFVSGDERCLAVAHARWHGLVHTLAARTLGDAREAEDVGQQVFLAAWRGRAGYRPERGPFPGWLVGITRRKTADALTARSRRRALEVALGERLWPEATPVPYSDGVVERLVVTGELAKLPTAQREVLAMAFYGDLTQVQIAERTGMPLGTVKSHARRGLDRLRRSLSETPAAPTPTDAG
ncbi:RNA polymerase subunit sigma-24 [Streptomyces venezuelae]|uniref:sigma-70 family RNA polymerase sigma factor n=1 Tax=Streptomyces venezuelae TaxID=54571 RepID=UPI00123D278E|nr:sigma-70 family RNA polymerase sigma factor [Streptomyces venezuelae]QES11392.1 RNA polymerase subunit sigma-24 [Streptomyces venezuelae]